MSRRPSARQLGVYASALAIAFVAGCCLVALAWALRVWAFGHLDKNEHMVTTGPYAHTRNPAYLGSFLAMVGIALAAGNAETTRGRLVWGLAAGLCVAFFACYLPRTCEREYTRLRRLFGPDLDQHAANVPDFLPRLRPWRSGDSRRFSWRRVIANNEWPWGLVLSGLLCAIWFAHAWSPFTVMAGGQ
jgi:protein-S-isoprenylcysteine O-methyltransferase Ste14